MNTTFILLQAAGGSGWETILMIVALVAIFYFLMIRPQQKKQKEMQEFRNGIRRGDKIITAGGIYGTVRQVKENSFLIEVDKNVQIEVDKASVYAPAAPAHKQEKPEKQEKDEKPASDTKDSDKAE